MKEITSRKNPVAKGAAALASSAEKRRECGAYLVEGARLVADASESGVRIEKLFYTEEAGRKYSQYIERAKSAADEWYVIDSHVADLLSTTKNSQGVFAQCSMSREAEQELSGKVALLENIQDPSNLGAILRTAEALGISHVVLSGECCDQYSPKCLRASMGAVFRSSFHKFSEAKSACDFLREKEYRIFGAVPSDQAEKITEFRFPELSAVAIGNEGNGLTQEMKELCDTLITIPMKGRAESLNAATAAAIVLWEMTK